MPSYMRHPFNPEFILTEFDSDSDILSDSRKSEQISELDPVCQFLHILIVSIIIGSERISESKSDSVSGNTL